MRITVLCVGKIKEKYWNDGISEYLKRLQKYAKVEIIEVPDEKTKENASPAENRAVKEKEGRLLLQKCPQNAYPIALAIDGKTFDSVELSKKLNEYMVNCKDHLALFIGGSLGLSEEVLSFVSEKWSFSKLTFPHQMMRVILLEQIYRGFRILKNEPYHK